MSGAEDSDLQTMIESLKGMENGPQYQFKLRQIADLYAKTDPEKGFEWLNSLPQTMESVVAFNSFFGMLGYQDPQKAILWVDQIRFEGGQKAAALSTSIIVASQNPSLGWDLLDKWAALLPPPLATMKGRLIHSISQAQGADVAWSTFNPKNLPLTQQETTIFFKAARFNNPKEAFDFAIGKAPASTQSIALEAIVQNWSPTKLKSVSEELVARPIDPKLDGAYSALAGRLLVTDPISAAQWSKVITDPKIRDVVQKQVKDYARINDKGILGQVNDIFEKH
jgi:hypothetical protein